MKIATMTCVVLAAVTSAAEAQESPYVAIQDRPIKALSAEDISGYLEGRGMGFALAAELNGYPGPRHVLELADSLGLGTQRRQQIQGAYDRMHAEAVRLGEAIVCAETALDSAFAAHRMSDRDLEQQLARIATLHGELRYAHLSAHLEVTELLSEHERHEYQRLRGYGQGHEGAHRHDGNHE